MVEDLVKIMPTFFAATEGNMAEILLGRAVGSNSFETTDFNPLYYQLTFFTF